MGKCLVSTFPSPLYEKMHAEGSDRLLLDAVAGGEDISGKPRNSLHSERLLELLLKARRYERRRERNDTYRVSHLEEARFGDASARHDAPDLAGRSTPGQKARSFPAKNPIITSTSSHTKHSPKIMPLFRGTPLRLSRRFLSQQQRRYASHHDAHHAAAVNESFGVRFLHIADYAY